MIYLDNAATTFPKPFAVSKEVFRCMTEYCGNSGRSGHSLSLAAANKIFECRTELVGLFGARDPSKVIFTQNATHALNIVIKGLLRKGDHVIISDIEHNSVLRPIQKLADKNIITYDIFKSRICEDRRNSTLVCAEIAKLLKKNTRLVVCNHSSNICSASLPISEIGRFCRRHGIFFAVDASQSAGVLPIDIEKMNIDVLCAPGHKALYGPQGSGFIILADKIELDTLLEGGSGTNSLEPRMPETAPERYEAGTLSTPAIAGLCEGVKLIRRIGIPAIGEYERDLCRYALEQLSAIKGIKIYAWEHLGSTILINQLGYSSEELSRKLNEVAICTRGGFHCAPLAHKTLGTLNSGGLRISLGIFNKKTHIDTLCQRLSELSAKH